jgi:hypothetical protein
MGTNWTETEIAFLFFGGLAIALTLWTIHVKRHPITRMTPWMTTALAMYRGYWEIAWSVIYAFLVMVAFWILLHWLTQAIATGQLTPLVPKRSPWKHLMFSSKSRPWNILGILAFMVTMTAIFYRIRQRLVRLIDSSLRRASKQLGLSFRAKATVFVADWWHRYIEPRAVANFALAGNDDDPDLALITNRCWALYRDQEPLRILVVSIGPYPTILRREQRMAVWVCLYLCKPNGGDQVLSSESQQALREQRFDIRDRPGYLRICDLREYELVGTQPTQEATAPDRIALLWHLAQPRAAMH